MYHKILKIVGLLMALGLAFIVAFISVNGLMKVFSGVGEVGLYFFIGIEMAKLVITSMLHTFRERLNFLLKSFGTLIVLIMMAVTSLGCYGFLSASYKQSYGETVVVENKVKLLGEKKTLVDNSKLLIIERIDSKRDRIKDISSIRGQQENRMDSLFKKGWYTAGRRVKKSIEDGDKNITKLEVDIEELSNKVMVSNDSINSYSLQIIQLNQNNTSANELGPLKYLSDVSGMEMDDVMKWFILFLIFIGDPAAVLLVIMYNKIVEEEKKSSEDLSVVLSMEERGSVDFSKEIEIKDRILEKAKIPKLEILPKVEYRPSKELIEEKEDPFGPPFGSAVPPIKGRLGDTYEKERENALNRVRESMGEQTFISPPPLTQPSALDLTNRKEITPFVEDEKPSEFKQNQYHMLLEENDFNDEVSIPKKEGKFTFDVVEEKTEEIEEEEVIKPEQLVIPPKITRNRKPGSGYMGIRRV